MTDPAPEPPRFSIARAEGADGVELRLAGRFTFDRVAEAWERIRADAGEPTQPLRVDLSGVERIDGGTSALLVQLKRARQASGVRAELVGANEDVTALLALYDEAPAPSLRPPPGGRGVLTQIGAATRAIAIEVRGFLAFVGRGLRTAHAAALAPRSVNWGGVRPVFEQAGADALPIVVLINFLIGFILAFQSAGQLARFGADIFVADLVALSVTREMGPLMTAIIVCGRSGAAFAASLGTMKVSEEIDALAALGFDPIRYLVAPRALALALALPALVLLADGVAIAGGLLVSVASLDLTAVAYLRETVAALTMWDVGSGLVKSVVFALAIALIACQQGLATSGGAEGVGRRTTTAVVAILFSLILIDALFTVLFFVYGL